MADENLIAVTNTTDVTPQGKFFTQAPPASMSRQQLDAQSMDYLTWKLAWSQYQAFYLGGDYIKKNAYQYLIKGQREPADIYAERVNRCGYDNYIGSIIDWYAATLFRIAPEIIYPDKDWFSTFSKDCTGAGKSLLDMMRDLFISAQIYHCSYVLVDLPKPVTGGKKPANRAQEAAAGLDQFRLVAYSPLDVFDVKYDDKGVMEWIKIRTIEKFRPTPNSPMMVRYTWRIYDRAGWVEYRKDAPGENAPAELASTSTQPITIMEDVKDDKIFKTDGGPHAFSALGKVPFFKLELPEGLWFSNRAGLLAWQHFQMENALHWLLHMSAYAMPVIKTTRQWNEIMGPAYFIRLGPNDDFGWSEPSGAASEQLRAELVRLQQEMYRTTYLMSQSQAENSGNVGQSGLSKQYDYQASMEILKAFGGLIRDMLNNVLTGIGTIRQDLDANAPNGAVDIRGLTNFDLRSVDEDLNLTIQSKQAVTLSPTMIREMEKRVSHRLLSEVDAATLERVNQEIDTNPIPDLQLAQEISQLTQGSQQAQPGDAQGAPGQAGGAPGQSGDETSGASQTAGPSNVNGWQVPQSPDGGANAVQRLTAGS